MAYAYIDTSALAKWYLPEAYSNLPYFKYCKGLGALGRPTRHNAPNSKHRAQVTPAKRGKVKKPRSLDEDQTPAECRAAMTWANQE